MRFQTGEDLVDVLDGEHDAADAERMHGDVRCADRRWLVELAEFQLGAAIRCAQHGDVAPDAVEPCSAVDPFPFDGRIAFELRQCSIKNAIAAFMSSTTMPMLSISNKLLFAMAPG